MMLAKEAYTAILDAKYDRLALRQNDISDANADLIALQKANAESFTTAERQYITTVDTSQINWQEKLSNL